MKNILFGSILLLLFSCESLVEEEVFSTITPNNFFTKEQDVVTAVNGIYDGLQDHELWYRLFLVGEALPGSIWHHWDERFNTLLYEDNEDTFWPLWQRNYNIIGRVNGVLKALETSSLNEDLKTQYEGEVRFIRAHCYFNLVRLFGHLPLVTSVPNSLADAVLPDEETLASTESEFLVQRDREDIYAFIISELEFCEENLAEVEYNNGVASGRATRGSAQGLLARVYITMAGLQYDYNAGGLKPGDNSYYTEAANKCTEIINEGSYRLMDNFSEIFENINDNNEECLFSIQYIESAVSGIVYEGNPYNTKVTEGSPSTSRLGIRGSNITPYSYKQCLANLPFFLDFVDKNGVDDPRYATTFLTEYYDKNGNLVPYGSGNFRYPQAVKFTSDYDYPDIQAQNVFDYGDNPIVIRYADILLMHSEALNESGGTPNEQTISGINQVLERVGKDPITLPISKEELRELIFQERKWELCYEGHYFFDCQRTGRLISEIEEYWHDQRSATPTEKYYILPIHYNALQSNPGLKQNFGW